MTITVKYFYSACVKISIETDNNDEKIDILCDPWFTTPIYYGSWYQYPELKNPLKNLGNCDYIYISHIHPDHYDPIFLKKYIDRYGKKKIIIQKREPNFLLKKMIRDGFSPIETEVIENEYFSINIFPIEPNHKTEIDSAMLVKAGNYSVVNMNDCNYSEIQLNNILRCASYDIDIALMNYTPASSYPQCYLFNETQMNSHKLKIQEIYYNKFEKMRQKLSPKISIPFAGQYCLGGPNFKLNSNLGVLDAVEIANKSADTLVLEAMGTIDTKNLLPSKERLNKYELKKIKSHASNHASKDYEYSEIKTPSIHEISECSMKIFVNLFRNTKFLEPFNFALLIEDQNEISLINFINCPDVDNTKLETFRNYSSLEIVKNNRRLIDKNTDYILIALDSKLLWGIITGKFHWNNVYVGSLAKYDRYPEYKHRKDIFDSLNFFRAIKSK